ncbi:MAG: hypothetical protein V1659_01760 [Candidatus Woesearchaeota archaeon]
MFMFAYAFRVYRRNSYAEKVSKLQDELCGSPFEYLRRISGNPLVTRMVYSIFGLWETRCARADAAYQLLRTAHTESANRRVNTSPQKNPLTMLMAARSNEELAAIACIPEWKRAANNLFGFWPDTCFRANLAHIQLRSRRLI